MQILVNAIPLMGLSTGISRYVRQLYSAFLQLSEEKVNYFDGYHILDTMPEQADPEKWSRQTAAIWSLPDPIVFSIRSIHWLKFEWMLRRACQKKKLDVYHETGFVPAALTTLPTVYTIHDLTLITHSNLHPRERVWFHEFFRKRRMRYATHILTVSEFMRQEICQILHLKPEDVTAVPEAPAPLFYPRIKIAIQSVCQKLSLPNEFLLFVGSLEPRKNLSRIVQALRMTKTDIPLVIVGWEGWGDKGWKETIEKTDLRKRIYFTGYVDDESLSNLYSGATALVYPSLYEGFGLPILEAMACGCPVICSNLASMPEVAGDAAMKVNPYNVEELAAAIDNLTGDTQIWQKFHDRGLKRSSTFTWKRSAEQTRDVFRQVATEGFR